MKVLLLQDVDNLGMAGDVAKVAAGYGRNFLIPQNMAVLATKNALKQSEAIRKAGELRRAQEKEDALAILNQINGKVVVFERKAGDQNKLYGSVTASDIVNAINEKYGLEISKRKIVLPEPIRSLGQYDITVKLMIEVSAVVKVVVIGEGESLEETATAKATEITEAEAVEDVVAETAEAVEEAVEEVAEVAEETEDAE